MKFNRIFNAECFREEYFNVAIGMPEQRFYCQTTTVVFINSHIFFFFWKTGIIDIIHVHHERGDLRERRKRRELEIKLRIFLFLFFLFLGIFVQQSETICVCICWRKCLFVVLLWNLHK